MKPCTCTRCTFFRLAAEDLWALGDLQNGDLCAAEVTWENADGSLAIAPLSECASVSVYLAQWTPEKRAYLSGKLAVHEGYTETWHADSAEVN